MVTDTRKPVDFEAMDLNLEPQIEEILKGQIKDLEKRIRIQLEEKALTWVEEECKKRLEFLRNAIRQEIQREVEVWIEEELQRRMDQLKERTENI